MHLDLIIDVVCPWCFVGERQLGLAIGERPHAITSFGIRPFQLSPNTPKEGVDRATYYKQKFGDGPELEASRKHLMQMGEALGITFEFEKTVQIANTLDAHRLIRWAHNDGKQVQVAEGLMIKYFEEGAFLGDHEVLADVARDAGLDVNVIKDLLKTDCDTELIKQDCIRAAELGVNGVPFYIFEGKYGVSGAQSPDVLIQVIDNAIEKIQEEKQQS